MTHQTDLTLADTTSGLDNPTLALNLSDTLDYSISMQYLNLMHQMRAWIVHREVGWGGGDLEMLREQGLLDEHGWPTGIPEGMGSVGTVFNWSRNDHNAEEKAGRYVVEYEGEGTLIISGDAEIIESEPGRIVFDSTTGHKLFVTIHETDPNGTGDYIRDISIVREEYVDMYKAGALFNPEWLEIVQDAREVRFMDWMGTNGSQVTSWDQMPSADGPNMGNGAPIEHMVQLANETGTDPWFTMPHLADENYIRKFAEYVRDNLDPALKVRVEYSNEVWNWNFEQTHWMRDKSIEEWGQSAFHDYYVKKSVETALIWKDVFGDQAEDRVISVVAVQTVDTWRNDYKLTSPIWKENEPDNYVNPADVFDEMAVTTYFGGQTTRNLEQRTALLEAIADPNVDAQKFLYDRMLDPNIEGSIPHVAETLQRNADIAAEHGLRLVSYEGGQHIHQRFKAEELTKEEIEALSVWVGDFVKSPYMGDLYRELWKVWEAVGDGSFMQYNDLGGPSIFGSWGLYDGVSDTNTRTEALEEFNSTHGAWWEGGAAGDQYTHGKFENGTAGDDVMAGTIQEDYLSGKDGDDKFIGGKGNDGIHGGGGYDTAVLSGLFSDYVLRVEGDGIRVTGPDGSDLLIDIEELQLDDNQRVVLADLIEAADGTLWLEGEVPTVEPVTPAEPKVEPEEPKAAPEPEDEAKVMQEGTFVQAGSVVDASYYELAKMPNLAGIERGLMVEAIDAQSELGQLLGVSDETSKTYLSYVTGTRDPSAAFVRELMGDDAPMAAPLLRDAGTGSGAIIKNANTITLSNWDDTFNGGAADDSVRGYDGDDELHGGAGRDSMSGNAGNDVLFGGAGNDLLRGRSGEDELYGEGGNDWLGGGGGNDLIYGGTGADEVMGYGGHDEMYGDEGNDVLNGFVGNDKLYGGADDDELFGGGGSDILYGGAGNDVLVAGNGRDHFVFAAGDGHDVIKDFAWVDTLHISDFLGDMTLQQAAGMEDGNLVLSNGIDKITFEGLETNDLEWFATDLN